MYNLSKEIPVMQTKTLSILAFLILFMLNTTIAQNPAGVIRGTVTDQVSGLPLGGATVTLVNENLSLFTDSAGQFRFVDLPLRSYRISISYAGYNSVQLEAVSVQSGKELVLSLPMETAIRMEAEVRLKTRSRRNQPINDMSLASARAFTVEETQKYAAAVNDPLRMATAFPGVMSADDGMNQIIIRGNSPTGLLWRMEGMDIPNPNHFSNAGATGGGISILSAQLLANSDFVTGAFAPEYGNALSGVFDLKLRKGNNEKKEYTVQAGVLGLNLAAEGPFSKKYKGSYLVNYRYSTLNLLNKVGILPDESSTNFQDLSYHLYLPAGKAGHFTVFGFAGLSKDRDRVEADSNTWKERSDRSQSEFVSNTAYTALTHQLSLSNRARLESGIGYAITRNGFDEDLMDYDYNLQKNFRDRYLTRKWNIKSAIHYRINPQWQLQAGVQATRISLNYYQLMAEHEGFPLEERINSREQTYTQQAFVQARSRLSQTITLTGGLHYLRLSLNGTDAIDPRLALRWQLNERSTLGLAYGLHSQMQPLGVYFAQASDGQGGTTMVNRNLDFTRSHHFVASYQYRLNTAWLLKAEAYYQQLFQVPVGIKSGSRFSTLNILDDFISDPLANSGKGRNYGLELSAERYLRNQFYFLFSQSVYQSKYTAQDGVERNTRFNGNYISTLVMGRDFVSYRGTRKWGINLKTVLAGGQRTKPIDHAASQAAGYTVFDEDRSYSLQNPAYFRTDLRLSIQWNRSHQSSTLSLDIQNVSNRLNVFAQWYDPDKGEVVTLYQSGLIPVLNWKIEF